MTFSSGKIILGIAAALALVLAAGFIAVAFFDVNLFGVDLT
ncbi:hypothetical protein HD599_000267 [Conyzicola lurida]|uniref:Uncharacterized protein n=1 Tax=Conyzicola lurida TaxID=1172621 RepID=A0A841AHQ4_9MICO|nr:hypothetical protein [Conyzicola lurida]MBB5841944.1 hypothetical protein [Conyzicola lurida]